MKTKRYSFPRSKRADSSLWPAKLNKEHFDLVPFDGMVRFGDMYVHPNNLQPSFWAASSVGESVSDALVNPWQLWRLKPKFGGLKRIFKPKTLYYYPTNDRPSSSKFDGAPNSRHFRKVTTGLLRHGDLVFVGDRWHWINSSVGGRISLCKTVLRLRPRYDGHLWDDKIDRRGREVS